MPPVARSRQAIAWAGNPSVSKVIILSMVNPSAREGQLAPSHCIPKHPASNPTVRSVSINVGRTK